MTGTYSAGITLNTFQQDAEDYDGSTIPIALNAPDHGILFVGSPGWTNYITAANSSNTVVYQVKGDTGHIGIGQAVNTGRVLAAKKTSADSAIQLWSSGGSGLPVALISSTSGEFVIQDESASCVGGETACPYFLMNFNGGTPQVLIKGPIYLPNLKVPAQATGKKVVCVDTTTGKLYASSTSTECLN